jgi:hypothetical protein
MPLYNITMEGSPPGGGDVSGGGLFGSGVNVTAAAVPNLGYVFVNWTESGAVVSTSPTYQFKATASRALTAHFGH